jgi:hypothetical protein
VTVIAPIASLPNKTAAPDAAESLRSAAFLSPFLYRAVLVSITR